MIINQYVNGFEQYFLLASKEVVEDGELNSIEFSYYGGYQQYSIVVSLLKLNHEI